MRKILKTKKIKIFIYQQLKVATTHQFLLVIVQALKDLENSQKKKLKIKII
jgi:hypothetical protein